MEPSIFAYPVGWSGRPWCCFAGTVCLFCPSRKHHGTHFHLKDSGIDAALAAWTTLATDRLDVSTASISPSPPVSTAQRVWDDQCCKTQFGKLVHATSDPVDQARLLASCFPGSGDWLHALTVSSVGLKMDNATVRITAGLRLGAPVVRTHSCLGGTTVTADGHHGLSCRRGSGRHSRHNQINDLFGCAFTSSGTLSTREPHSLCTTGGKRPDGVTLVPWKHGRCLAWDATCPDTYAQSAISLRLSGYKDESCGT